MHRIVQRALFLYLLLCNFAYAEQRLVFSIDIVRHGDRNPGIEIPKSPHSWKGELGALTDAGVQREQKLGSELRKEYIEKESLLPHQYQPGALYVRSTDFSRTKESARALLEGLYPKELRRGNEIPVETVKLADEDLLLVHPSSNPFSVIKMFFWKRSFWNEQTRNIREDLERWSAATGLKIENMDDLSGLSDNLYIRQLNGISLPPGIDVHAAEKIIALDEFAIVSLFEHEEISRPTGIKLVSAIKGYFDKAKENKSQLKYVLYMAHDATIMSILNTMGIKFKTPGYASRVNVSLVSENDVYQIKVSHDGKVVHPKVCKDSICSYSEFFDLLK